MVLLALGLVQAMVLVSYFGINFPAIVAMGNDGWCDLNTESIGWHCFGDYHQLVNIQPGDSVRIGNQEVQVSSQGKSPLGGMLSDVFTAIGGSLGQRGALILWLTVLLVAIVMPMWLATYGLRRPLRVIALTTMAVVTLPSWAIIDRGQQQGLTIPFLFAFAVALMRGRMATAAVMAAVAALIKPQFAILFLALFIYPGTRLRVSKWWLGTVVAGFLIAFVPYGSSGTQRFTSMVNQILGVGAGDYPFTNTPSVRGLVYSTALPVDMSLPSLFSQGLYRVITPISDSPGIVEIAASLRESHLYSFAVLLAFGSLLVVILVLHKYITKRDLIISTFVIAGLSVAPAYIYHVSFVIPVAAVLIGSYSHEQDASDSGRSKDRLLWIAVAASLAPIVVPLIPLRRRDSIATSDLLYVDNVLPLIVSALWLVLVVRTCVSGLFSYLKRNEWTSWATHENSLIKATPSILLLLVGLPVVGAGLLAPSKTSYVIAGGESPRETLGVVGVGTTSTLRVYPDLFDRQLGEYQLYFPGSEACSSAVMDFRWENVTFASTSPSLDGNFSVEFPVVGSTNAYLEISSEGRVSWNADGVAQYAELPVPICLVVDGAELAAHPQRYAILQAQHQSPVATVLFGLLLSGFGLTQLIRWVSRNPAYSQKHSWFM